MITECIRAWSAQRHVNVNGRCFNQTDVIENKKYALLVNFTRKKTGSMRVLHYNQYRGVTILAITGFYCTTVFSGHRCV